MGVTFSFHLKQPMDFVDVFSSGYSTNRLEGPVGLGSGSLSTHSAAGGTPPGMGGLGCGTLWL